MMLHAKYESSCPYGLGQEDFQKFPSLSLCETKNPQHRINFYSRAIVFSILVEGH